MSYKCLKDSKTKQYIVPTNEWLNPLSELITNDISTKGLLMLAKFNKTHDVVVKITRDISNFSAIKFATKKLFDMSNFVKTFCAFVCDESTINLESKYIESNGFCSANKDDKEQVIIEIMYKYDTSLNSRLGTLNKDNVEHIMNQLIYAQLNAFEKYGFLHMDIHLSNIMFNNENKNTELKYFFHKTRYMIKTAHKFVLCDFDKSIFYNAGLPLVPHKPINTLILNIIRTINKCAELFNNKKDWMEFRLTADKMQMSGYNYIRFEEKDLRSFYNKYITFDEYKEYAITNVISYLNQVWKAFFQKYLFPSYGL